MGATYRLENDVFILENFNQARPFSSFLPGIAGEYGKLMWAFYVNRGQCIAGHRKMHRKMIMRLTKIKVKIEAA